MSTEYILLIAFIEKFEFCKVNHGLEKANSCKMILKNTNSPISFSFGTATSIIYQSLYNLSKIKTENVKLYINSKGIKKLKNVNKVIR